MNVGEMEVVSAILCDDIRQDKQNKFMLIGVYNDSIIIPHFPAEVSMAFFFQFTIPAGTFPLFVKLSGPGEGSGVLEAGVHNSEKADFITFATPRLSVLMECEGEFSVSLSNDQENWMPIITKSVILGEVAQ